MQPLSDMDVDRIAMAVTARIGVGAALGLTAEEHAAHHDAIQLWVERQTRRAAMWDKIATQVGGWGIIVILGGIGVAVWHFATDMLQRG